MSRRARNLVVALGASLALAVAGCGAAAKLQQDAKRLGDDASKSAENTVGKENIAKAQAVAKKVESLTAEATPEQEYYLGRAVSTSILAEYEYKYLDADAVKSGNLAGVTAYVNQVGSVLSAAATEVSAAGDRPAPIAGWHFVVVEKELINGASAPGGFVFITTGAVQAAKSEDELAALLAHEIAHVQRGHSIGSIQQSRYADLSADLLQAAGKEALTPEQVAKLSGVMDGAVKDMTDAFFTKGYSRDTEFEADRRAVQILARAGYNPNALASYLGTLAEHTGNEPKSFFATHPPAQDRIERVKAQIAESGWAKVATSKTRTARFTKATAELK